MGLLSFLERSPTAASASDPGDEVQRVRVRARQRLIGAVVLIVAGVIGFPLLFETQPRPIPVDIPIEIARKDQVPPLVMPPPRARAASAVASNETMITETSSEAGREVAAAPAKAGVASAPASAAPSKAEKTPSAVVQVVPTQAASAAVVAAPRPAPAADESPRQRVTDTKSAAAREPAKEAPKESAKKDDAASVQGRYVVQVGSFSDAAAARDVRQKVEKLGLKTHTQVVETADGRRIRVRVGPFASRDDAEKAAGKVKSAGLSTALFPL